MDEQGRIFNGILVDVLEEVFSHIQPPINLSRDSTDDDKSSWNQLLAKLSDNQTSYITIRDNELFYDLQELANFMSDNSLGEYSIIDDIYDGVIDFANIFKIDQNLTDEVKIVQVKDVVTKVSKLTNGLEKLLNNSTTATGEFRKKDYRVSNVKPNDISAPGPSECRQDMNVCTRENSDHCQDDDSLKQQLMVSFQDKVKSFLRETNSKNFREAEMELTKHAAEFVDKFGIGDPLFWKKWLTKFTPDGSGGSIAQYNPVDQIFVNFNSDWALNWFRFRITNVLVTFRNTEKAGREGYLKASVHHLVDQFKVKNPLRWEKIMAKSILGILQKSTDKCISDFYAGFKIIEKWTAELTVDYKPNLQNSDIRYVDKEIVNLFQALANETKIDWFRAEMFSILKNVVSKNFKDMYLILDVDAMVDEFDVKNPRRCKKALMKRILDIGDAMKSTVGDGDETNNNYSYIWFVKNEINKLFQELENDTLDCSGTDLIDCSDFKMVIYYIKTLGKDRTYLEFECKKKYESWNCEKLSLKYSEKYPNCLCMDNRVSMKKMIDFENVFYFYYHCVKNDIDPFEALNSDLDFSSDNDWKDWAKLKIRKSIQNDVKNSSKSTQLNFVEIKPKKGIDHKSKSEKFDLYVLFVKLIEKMKSWRLVVCGETKLCQFYDLICTFLGRIFSRLGNNTITVETG